MDSSTYPYQDNDLAAGAGDTGAAPALCYVQCDPEPSMHELPMGAKRHLIIISTAPGRIFRETGGRRAAHTVEPGFVTVVPKGQPVRWWWDDPIGFEVLALDHRALTEIAGRGAPDSPRIRFTETQRDHTLSSIAKLAGDLKLCEQTPADVYGNPLARLLATHLLNSYAESPDDLSFRAGSPSSKAVQRAVNFIEQHYASDIRIEDIARAAFLSPFHLSRLFRRETGLAPHQYLVRVRLEAARGLLATAPGSSLSDIATAVGFYDQSHMTRQFRRIFGITPRQAERRIATQAVGMV
jgi:AraC family transcriptional regulator